MTHDEIAKMTIHEVNVAITQRIGTVIYDEDLDTFYPTDYTGDWTHAGRLLEIMADDHVEVRYAGSSYECYAFRRKDDDILTFDGSARTAPEAIARCWLEWHDAPREATP